YVITGGPGVGKTALIDELQSRGYETVPETARALIAEQQHINGDALPWKDRFLYKELMFDRSVESYAYCERTMYHHQAVFFDRGILDSICYAGLIHAQVDAHMKFYAEHWRYNNTVFILPAWREIYKTDGQRRQRWEEAVLTFEKMKETYIQYGYTAIELPKVSVNER